jgi:ribonuclease HI
MYTKATIFSDGASRGNPGRGGWGAIILFEHDDPNLSHVIELGGREDNTTNNRMELTGALEAIRTVESSGIRKAAVYTDSGYLVNSLTKWVHGWVKNDWQTKDKKNVLNRDLLECFYDLFSLIEISFHQVPGHSGVPANERCDEIATNFADQKPIELFDGLLSEYNVSLTTKPTGDVQKSKSAKAYSYVSEIGGDVQVHATWEACRNRVEGKRARFKKTTSKENETEIIALFKR